MHTNRARSGPTRTAQSPHDNRGLISLIDLPIRHSELIDQSMTMFMNSNRTHVRQFKAVRDDLDDFIAELGQSDVPADAYETGD